MASSLIQAVFDGHAEGAADAPARSAGASAALPCLLVTSQLEKEKEAWKSGKSAVAKRAETLFLNLEGLWKRRGINSAAFATITTKDGTSDRREFQRRFNILNTNFLRKVPDYEAIWVVHRREDGSLHLHGGLSLPWDIRTGFDFESLHEAEQAGKLLPGQLPSKENWKAAEQRRRAIEDRSNWFNASPELRKWWHDFGAAAERYGFGRCETFPVKSNAEGCARYVGTYVVSEFSQRRLEDKGLRTVRYAIKRVAVWCDGRMQKASLRVASCNFSWVKGPALAFRRGCAYLAAILNLDDFAEQLGEKWGYHWGEAIMLLGNDPGRCDLILKNLNPHTPISERLKMLGSLTHKLRIMSKMEHEAWKLTPGQFGKLGDAYMKAKIYEPWAVADETEVIDAPY